MRPTHFSLSARKMTGFAVSMLMDSFHWSFSSSVVTVRQLLQLLVFASVRGRSLSSVVEDSPEVGCWESVRTALMGQLPSTTRELDPVIQETLHQRLPRSLSRRPRTMAIDYHCRPFYGDKKTKGTTRGKAKAGTKTFFTHATMILIRKGQTFTVAMTPVAAGEEQTDVLDRLLRQVQARGLQIKRLLLDREFYSATTHRWLQQKEIPFVMPMIRRGKSKATKDQCTGTAQFFVARRRGWSTYQYTGRPRRKGRKQPGVTVTIDVCMVPKRTHQSRRTQGPLVFACWRTTASPAQVRQLYRKRFRIETSYRQLGECLAKTCSTNSVFRLLLILIALAMRNLWVWLHYRFLAQRDENGITLQLHLLRLQKLASGIAGTIERILNMRLEIITV